MINNTEQFNREFKLSENLLPYSTDMLGILELGNKYLIVISDKDESREAGLKIVKAWNKDPRKIGNYIRVKHTPTEAKNVYYLKDSIITDLYSKKGFSSYNKTFIEFLKEFAGRYSISKFGSFNCSLNRERGDQEKPTVYFENLGTGNLRPSDIDNIVLKRDKLIINEVKTGGGKLSYGQQLVIQRVVDAWEYAGGEAVGTVIREGGYIKAGDIDSNRCWIENSYRHGSWDNKIRKEVDKTISNFINS